MAFKFFHLPKAKKFNYIPRFYDPALEERMEREIRIKAELGISVNSNPHDPGKPYTPHIRGQFRKAMGYRSRTTPEMRRSSNNRLLIIIAILAFLFFLLFYR